MSIGREVELYTFKSSSVKGAQYGSTEAQNLLGVSFLAEEEVFTCSRGNSQIEFSTEAGFCKILID